jgi:hypothetical protein
MAQPNEGTDTSKRQATQDKSRDQNEGFDEVKE